MAGEVTARVSLSGSVAGITFGGVVSSPTGESPFGFQRAMAIGTNIEIDLPITISKLGLLFLEANVDCTLQTNSTSTASATDIIPLKANVPLKWQTGDPTASRLLTGDVVQFYGTFTAVTTLKIGGMKDVTPAV